MCSDICVNVISDFVFVVVVGVMLMALSIVRRRIRTEASDFFGIDPERPFVIYVSTHSDPNTVSQKVVTVQEYEAAIGIRAALQQLRGTGFIHGVGRLLSGLIGHEQRFPEPTIETSPLGEVTDFSPPGSLILIGGPLRNQLTKFFSDKLEPPIIYRNHKFLKRVKENYCEIGHNNNVAVVVRTTYEDNVVLMVYGTGEKHTRIAGEYLVGNWRSLNKSHRKKPFGLLLLLDSDDNVSQHEIYPK